MCEGDKNQLVQVFTNIIINAAHAITGKGDITIRTSRDKPKGKVYIEFSDTGCGIPEVALPKIFDHFFLGDTYSKQIEVISKDILKTLEGTE